VSYPSGTILATIYKGGRVRDPSRTILRADAIESYENHNQVAEFKGQGLSFNNAAIHLIHQGRANVAFFDGHAESMAARNLRYDTATAPDHFFAANPGPGSWDTTPMFSPPYENIAYPSYPTPP
jgi:prepilin-type processing-associated H-X9-DG protein